MSMADKSATQHKAAGLLITVLFIHLLLLLESTHKWQNLFMLQRLVYDCGLQWIRDGGH